VLVYITAKVYHLCIFISLFFSRVLTVGESARSVRLAVERVQGLNYDVTVGYITRMMPLPISQFGVNVYSALEDENYLKEQGTLVFQQGSEVRINVWCFRLQSSYQLSTNPYYL
jgi:hypothetical protein